MKRTTTPLIALMIAVASVAIAAALGNIGTMPKIATWYAGLNKPSFTPPNWIFGPVWTLLYAMMAYAFYRVLTSEAAERERAIRTFLLQLALNAAWSWAFFWGESPRNGLLVMAFLWVAIIGTIDAFLRVDRIAAYLMMPYLAWVSFAAVLNFAVFRMN